MRRSASRSVLILASTFAAGAAVGYVLAVLTLLGRGAPGGRGHGPASLAEITAPGAASSSVPPDSSEPPAGAGRHETARRRGEAGASEDPEDSKDPEDSGERGRASEENRRGGPRRGRIEENPLAGLGAEELAVILEEAAASGDHRRLKEAAEALGPLTPEQVSRIADLFLATEDHNAAFLLARELVRHGGREGLEAVARFARDGSLGLEARAQAIEALAELPPEAGEAAPPIFASLLASGLPRKLEYHAADAYARWLGPGAATGLMDLLDAGAARAEPLLHAIRDHARAEDIPRLTDLLGRTGAREGQELLLKAIGSAAGAEGGRVLLDFLASPPQGLRREGIAGVLGELASREDLPRLWESLQGEADRKTQAGLALAIARAGGGPEIERLARLAGEPASGFSPEVFARAVHDAAGVESVPLLLDVLSGARSWESSEPLARAVAQLAGREGVEKLLAIAEAGGPADRRRAIFRAAGDFGDPGLADRMASLLQGERDQGAAFQLARAVASCGPRGIEAVEALLAQDSDPLRSGEVLRGLESVRPDEAAAVARGFLRDPSPELRRSAARILAASRDPSAERELAIALDSETDPKVRATIAALLEERARRP